MRGNTKVVFEERCLSQDHGCWEGDCAQNTNFYEDLDLF